MPERAHGLFWMNVAKASRSTGQSARAHVMYLIRDGRYARSRSGERDPCQHVECGHMPLWAVEAEGPDAERRSAAAVRYWEAADRHLRANGRLCRKVDFAQPRELSREQQIRLARRYMIELATLKDKSTLPFVFVLHQGDGTNPHVHGMVSEKVNDGTARTAETWFKRAATKGRPADSGGARQTDELDSREWLLYARELWAIRANQALQDAGFDVRIDHRSNAARGIDDLPTEHVGWVSGAPRHEALERNKQRRKLNDDLRELLAECASLVGSKENGATASMQGDCEYDHEQAERPGHCDVGNTGITLDAGRGQSAGGLAVARSDATGQDEPDAVQAAGSAAPAGTTGVRDMSGRSVYGDAARSPDLLHGHPDDFVGKGRSDSDRAVRRAGAGVDVGSQQRLATARAPGLAAIFAAASGNDLLNAQWAWMRMGAEFVLRMERLAAHVEAAKLAKAELSDAKVPRLSALQRLASLLKFWPQPAAKAQAHQSVSAPDMNLRPVEAMAMSDLREQLQIVTAAQREAARLIANGDVVADAAASRFSVLSARAKVLRTAISAVDDQPATVIKAPSAPSLVSSELATVRDDHAEREAEWRVADTAAKQAASVRDLRRAVAEGWKNVDLAKTQQSSASAPAIRWWPGAKKRADAAREEADAVLKTANARLRAAIAAAKRGGASVESRRSNAVALVDATANAKRAKRESDRLATLIAQLRAATIAAVHATQAADLGADVTAMQAAIEVANDVHLQQAKQARRDEIATSPIANQQARAVTYPVPGSRRRTK